MVSRAGNLVSRNVSRSPPRVNERYENTEMQRSVALRANERNRRFEIQARESFAIGIRKQNGRPLGAGRIEADAVVERSRQRRAT